MNETHGESIFDAIDAGIMRCVNHGQRVKQIEVHPNHLPVIWAALGPKGQPAEEWRAIRWDTPHGMVPLVAEREIPVDQVCVVPEDINCPLIYSYVTQDSIGFIPLRDLRPAPKPEHRLRRLILGVDTLRHLFSKMDGRHILQVDGLPEDVEFVAFQDDFTRKAVMALIRSAEFDVLADGDEIPLHPALAVSVTPAVDTTHAPPVPTVPRSATAADVMAICPACGSRQSGVYLSPQDSDDAEVPPCGNCGERRPLVQWRRVNR